MEMILILEMQFQCIYVDIECQTYQLCKLYAVNKKFPGHCDGGSLIHLLL